MPSLLHLKPTCNVYYFQCCLLFIVYCQLTHLSHQIRVNRSLAPCPGNTIAFVHITRGAINGRRTARHGIIDGHAINNI